MSKKLLITPNDFKSRYGIALSTQYLWRKEKKIPFEKVGKNVLYNQKEIDTLAQSGVLGSTPMLALQKEDECK